MKSFYFPAVLAMAASLFASGAATAAPTTPVASPTVTVMQPVFKQDPDTRLQTLQASKFRIKHTAFSPQGDVIACVGVDNQIVVRNIKTGTTVQMEQTRFNPEKNPHNIFSVALSPDGQTLATGSLEVYLWDTRTGQRQRVLSPSGKENEQLVTSLAFSPNGKLLATGSRNGTVRLWNARTGKWQASLKGKTTFFGSALAFTADGKRLAGRGGNIGLWDIESKKLIRTFDAVLPLEIAGMAFSPDGKILIIGGDRTPYKENWSPFDYGGFFGEVHVIDVNSGRKLKTLSIKDQRVYSMAFAPNGDSFSVGYTDGVRVWTRGNWKMRESQGLTGGAAKGVHYSPDSRTLTIVTDEATVHLWNMRSWKRGYLGVRIDDVKLPARAIKALNGTQNSGVQVISVAPGSAAHAAGLQKNDVIVGVNGKRTDSAYDLIEFVQSLHQGHVATMKVWRRTKLLSIKVKLGTNE